MMVTACRRRAAPRLAVLWAGTTQRSGAQKVQIVLYPLALLTVEERGGLVARIAPFR